MTNRAAFVLLVSAIGAAAFPLSRRTPVLAAPATFEDYKKAAGVRRGDTLTATFDLQTVRWRPEQDSTAELVALSFVERGKAARVPGPLLRVAEGQWVKVTLHNATPERLALFGFQDHQPGLPQDSVSVAPGEEKTVLFQARRPGTYYYWGLVRRTPATPPPPRPANVPPQRAFPGGPTEAGPFIGALIVDPAGTVGPPNEEILMLTRWFDGRYPGIDPTGVWKIAVNGASWPHTARRQYAVGDSVRWRVLNPMGIWHPMHLHGFYFTVTSRGDGIVDTLYRPEEYRTVVTELMMQGGTMAMTWVPERAGNWLFHCHLINHMSLIQRIGPPRDSFVANEAHAVHREGSPERAEDHMAGLVVGITVQPKPGTAGDAAAARASGRVAPERPRAAFRLFATTRPRVFGDAPAYSFIVQSGNRAPALDSARIPGTPIILRRGEPSSITVLNTLSKPLAVHWHGMEIESWYDGVGGWSGLGASVRPSTAPGDSFVVHITPPRAGTFIYHSHDETGQELASGLYGPLLVLEPGEVRDTTRDHLVIMGLRGPGKPKFSINGDSVPRPLALAGGVTHRLRFVSIPTNEVITVDLIRADSVVQQWRPVALDGADLPTAQRASRTARARMSAGQTLDVEVQLDPGELRAGHYRLQFRTQYYPSPLTVGLPALTIVPIVERK